jgi:methionine synthase I (cobalamin-dependent)
VRLALAAAAGRAAVFACLGPTKADAAALYPGLADMAMAAGADGVVLETMTDARVTAAAVAALTRAGHTPMISFTVDGAQRLLCGTPLLDAARAARVAGAAAIGVNCCDGPAAVLAGIDGAATAPWTCP